MGMAISYALCNMHYACMLAPTQGQPPSPPPVSSPLGDRVFMIDRHPTCTCANAIRSVVDGAAAPARMTPWLWREASMLVMFLNIASCICFCTSSSAWLAGGLLFHSGVSHNAALHRGRGLSLRCSLQTLSRSSRRDVLIKVAMRSTC